ncbi:MAG: type 4a pilus biogenesis protein PilO [Burkholderiaceae bacterium]|jgi:type IV pilus assembly protein PilO|nr:type 4a pilus biogenesis protein PilO [Burkholderiaceae bacterium]
MARFNPSIDLSAVTSQFQGLQGRHPGLWPSVPRFALLAAIVVALGAAAWGGYWRGQLEDLDARVAEEQRLKQEFTDKMRQAVNLEALREQKEQVMQYVSALEKQLPSKAEMDALLTDINQAGVGRGLQFELFKPGQVIVRDYYAELPIAIRVTGDYHAFGAFTSEIANLARIVTLNNLQVALPPERGAQAAMASGNLTMEAIAKTFRYLDPEEIAEQRRKAAEAKAKKK